MPRPKSEMPKLKDLKDLRPNAGINCFYCGLAKPQAGSQKFRAHHVCADCCQKLQQQGAKTP